MEGEVEGGDAGEEVAVRVAVVAATALAVEEVMVEKSVWVGTTVVKTCVS